MKRIECPTCDGEGSIEIPHYHSYDGYHGEERKCHNCEGSGEVEVDDDFDEEEDNYVEEMSYEEYQQAQKEAKWEYDWECENER